MEAAVLAKLFGTDGRWGGPCTVVVDAEANIQSIGSDAIVQGGIKAYSPRMITGRIQADHVMLLGERTLLLLKRLVQRQATGEDVVQHTVHVVDTGHVAAVEFDRLDALEKLGVAMP